jgi:hypothetical protein
MEKEELAHCSDGHGNGHGNGCRQDFLVNLVMNGYHH